MNNLTKDYIAIDTNVLVHLFNPQKNTNDHITELLKQLFFRDEIKLLVDTKKRIVNEYSDKLEDKIDDINIQSFPNGWFIRYSLTAAFHEQIEVNHNEPLMDKIKKIVQESTDKIFVYVAFKTGRILITNDEADIIDERKGDGERRRKLRRIPRKIRHEKKADILTSEKAYDKIANQS